MSYNFHFHSLAVLSVPTATEDPDEDFEDEEDSVEEGDVRSDVCGMNQVIQIYTYISLLSYTGRKSV